jgi:hypothetical protein
MCYVAGKMKTRFAVANLITTKAGGAPKAAGGGYSLRQLLGYLWRAYHIRFRFVADGATFVGHSEDSKIE